MKLSVQNFLTFGIAAGAMALAGCASELPSDGEEAPVTASVADSSGDQGLESQFKVTGGGTCSAGYATGVYGTFCYHLSGSGDICTAYGAAPTATECTNWCKSCGKSSGTLATASGGRPGFYTFSCVCK